MFLGVSRRETRDDLPDQTVEDLLILLEHLRHHLQEHFEDLLVAELLLLDSLQVLLQSIQLLALNQEVHFLFEAVIYSVLFGIRQTHRVIQGSLFHCN